MVDKKSRSGRIKKANSKVQATPKKRSRKANYAEKINLTLFHIANAVNISPDLDELYATIHKILSDVIDVTNFFIALYDKKSDVITFPFHRDEKDTVDAYDGGVIRHISQSKSITAQVVRTGQKLFFQKDEIMARYQNNFFLGTICEQWLGVPLRVRDEIIGAMVVQSYTNSNLYHQGDADLLLAVSDQVALAIELKKTLDTVKESEKRYRTLAEKTNDVVFSIDADGYFTEISPAIENITGYTREEIIGGFLTDTPAKNEEFKNKGWYRKCLTRESCLGSEYEHFIHPDDQQWASIRINEAVEKLSAYHLDYRLIKKNGRLHWISERGVVYENEAGQKQIEGIIQDIHKRKHAEDINQVLFSISNAVNTTRNLNELYSSIHQSLGRVIDASNFFIGLYNKQTDSIIFPFLIDEYDFHNTQTPELKDISDPKAGSLSGKVLLTGKPLLIKKKERREWIEKEKLAIKLTPAEVWLGVPLKISNTVIGVMAVQDYHDPNHYDEHDIDVLNSVSDQIALAIERRRSEEALRESKERYRHLVDNIDDIIFSVDENSHFSYLSPSVETITGYRVRDFKGRIINWNRDIIPAKRSNRREDNDFSLTHLFEAIIHPDDQKEVIKFISESTQSQAHYAIEYRVIKKNGRTHWVYEKGTPYHDAEQGRGIEGIIQDIHKRKHAEEVNQVLFSISNAVNIADNLEALYKSIHGSLSRIIDTTNFWIALYNQEKDSLAFAYVVDTIDDPANFKEHFNASNPNTPSRSTQVIRTGKPVLSTKADFIKQLRKLNLNAAKTISEIWLGVPLKIQGKVIGVMAVHSFDNPHLYDEEDADILMSVSEQIALAIEHKKSEEALQVEKARLEHLFADSREAIVMTDAQGRILKVNRAFTTLFGYHAEEIINRFIDDLIVPNEFISEAKSYTVSLSKGESDTIEVIRKNKDHKRLNVVATGIPIFVNGIVMGMYCIYRNITEQRRAENIQSVLYEIAKAVNSTQSLDDFFRIIHQSLGRIMDTTNFFIALCDLKNELINFEYSVDEKDNAIFEIPISHSASLTARVIRSKKPQFLKELEILEFFQQSSDKPIGSIAKLWMGVPLMIRNEIIGAVVLQSYHDPFCYSMDDVTLLESVSEQIAIAIDSKRTRDALEESENRYRTIFDGTADSIFVDDMGNRFLDVNELACRRYGYTREELLSLGPKDIAAHKQIERVYERVAAIKKSGNYMSEIMHIKKDGTLIPTELSSKIIEYLGKQAVLSVARDITERKNAEEEKKKLEDQLRQAQKMEAIGTLAGGIAHDFNNILSPIIGYTELSLYQLQSDDKAHKNMREVLKAADRAKNLVKQILTFSRQSEQEPKPIKVGPIVREVAKLLQATLPSFIQIVLRVSEEQGAIMADPTQIHQVLMNLGTNAYHAMRTRGGVLEINLSEIVLSFEDRVHHHNLMPGPYLKLSVSDTGHGISPMVIGRIFDPYFTTKDPGEGTGMGLAVVHGIIKSYKGEINVYSEPEVGTSFHIYLPEIVSEVTFSPIKIPAEVPRGNEAILLVDDEEQIVDMLQQMLLTLGYQVTARTSSIEALEAFKAQPEKFDLVITDQTMPNMSGAELARMLLRIRKEIPIILCTGFSEVVTEAQAKAIGIRAYVMKPIIKNEIATVIRRILEKIPYEKNK